MGLLIASWNSATRSLILAWCACMLSTCCKLFVWSLARQLNQCGNLWMVQRLEWWLSLSEYPEHLPRCQAEGMSPSPLLSACEPHSECPHCVWLKEKFLLLLTDFNLSNDFFLWRIYRLGKMCFMCPLRWHCFWYPLTILGPLGLHLAVYLSPALTSLKLSGLTQCDTDALMTADIPSESDVIFGQSAGSEW